MIGSLPPQVLMIVGAFLLFVLKGRLRDAWLLALPVLSCAQMLSFDHGIHCETTFLGQQIAFMRVDKLSLVFGLIFHIAAFIGVLFALRTRDRMQDVSCLVYAGSAIGAVFANDLLSLFIFWEIVAVSSAFLIFANRTRHSLGAGTRYLMIQIVSGLLLLGGAMLQWHETGSMAFDAVKLGSPSTWLLFFAFGIKCGWPGLHGWIVDGYPAATPSGTVFLSSFTTKLAVYTLARGFPGTELLIYIGTAMAVFPIFYAVIENDLRRVLCYSMINQIGYMVVGIGIGGSLGINGAAAHAFCDILFKGLLFMSMGAVLFRTGRINGSDLGGLYRTMPKTAVFCMIGAASISAFPLFSGFISKSIIMLAVAERGYFGIWLILLFGAAGVFHHAGIKIPYFAFFAHDSKLRPKEAPWNMLLAMALAAVACIGLGCFPRLLYDLLPHDMGYWPYDVTHVITQLQLLIWSALAFTVLMLAKIYPPELRSVNLDVDWFYRRGGPAFERFVSGPLMRAFGAMSAAAHEHVPRVLWYAAKNPAGLMGLLWDRLRLAWAGTFGPLEAVDERRAILARDIARYDATPPGTSWPIGTVVLYAAVLFLVVLLVYLV